MAPQYSVSLIVLLTSTLVQLCGSSVVHSHNSIDQSKEREADGSFRPRDASHYDSEGSHNQEFDHEAILGSVKEAMEFESLTPEESKRRLAELLPLMDINRDQSIDKSELQAWILDSFIKLSKEEAEERLSEIDKNQDGVLTWAEYADDAFRFDDDDEDDFSDENSLLESEQSQDKAMWSAADTDADGVLNFNEFEVFLHPEEHAALHPLLVNQTLRDKDDDRDGHLDFHEYAGERGSSLSKSWLISEREKFDDLDLDKDGKLNQEEVRRWVVPDNERIANEEVEHLFSAADDDRNDVLSFEEVLRHYDVFVGSEQYPGDSQPHFVDEL